MTQDRNFHKSCEKDGGKVGENWKAGGAARRRFLAIGEKPYGGYSTPLSRAKVNAKSISKSLSPKFCSGWVQTAASVER